MLSGAIDDSGGDEGGDVAAAEEPGCQAIDDVPEQEGDPNVLALQLRRSSDDCAVYRQFFASTLVPGSFISIDQGEPDGLFVCQVVALETKNVTVPTFKSELVTPLLFGITAQTYTVWSQEGVGGERMMFAFNAEEPLMIDVLSMCPPDVDPRSVISVWVSVPSDLDGCTCLQFSSDIRSQLSLSDLKVPVLALKDALTIAGFVGEARAIIHGPDNAELVYDCRKLVSKRFYLQCILSLQELIRAGAPPFLSSLPAGFFCLMLKSPTLALPGLSSAQYREQLQLTNVEMPRLAALQHVAPACPAALAILDDVAGDDSEIDEVIDVAAPASPQPAAVLDEGVAGDDDGSSGEEPAYQPPEYILGQKVVVERKFYPDGSLASEGIRVKCQNPFHGGHSRYRSVRLDNDRHGMRAAEFYLWAWLSESFSRSEGDHHVWRPGRADVQAIVDTYGGAGDG
jgi:hypothetical protein